MQSTMASSDPRVEPVLCILLPALSAPVAYQLIRYDLSRTGAIGYLILEIAFLPAGQRNHADGTPSGIYITLMSILCISVGLVCDTYTESTWTNCYFHFVVSYSMLMLSELVRYSWLHRRLYRRLKSKRPIGARFKSPIR
jgi:hypothetical protein